MKTKFGCYANVRELSNMKQCLNCQKEFQYKRGAAKFCSNKCRAAYNRSHPKQTITPIQMQVLYNSVLEAISKINAKNGLPEPMTAVFVPQQHTAAQMTTPLPRVAIEAIKRKYVEDRRDCTCDEEYYTWLQRLESDTRLNTRDKELVKNTY